MFSLARNTFLVLPVVRRESCRTVAKAPRFKKLSKELEHSAAKRSVLPVTKADKIVNTLAQRHGPSDQLSFETVLRESNLSPDDNAEKFLQSSDKFRPAVASDIDWNEGMVIVKGSEELYPVGRVDRNELSERIRAIRPARSVADIINESATLKRMIDLGVNLAEWEKNGLLARIMALDFDRDVAPRIRFLVDNKVHPDRLGSVLTRNPFIFEQDMDDLQVRINYLASKSFTPAMKRTIIEEAPQWLNHSVVDIDHRLGFLQKSFKLNGNQVRSVATGEPNLIPWKGLPLQIVQNKFCVVEEMGFTEDEAKEILVSCPSVYMVYEEKDLFQQFDLLHNVVGFPHELLKKFPDVLLDEYHVSKPRHLFLKHLGRNQYDPKKPNYVSPRALTSDTDLHFCEKVAKAPIELYNDFMKTV